MDNKIILGSLAMDLKRAALSYHQGSNIMAERFLNEANKRKKEYKKKDLKPYMKHILDKIEELKMQPKDELAENAPMYSTLIQNYILSS